MPPSAEDFWRFDGIVLPGHIGPETARTYGESYSLEIWLTGEIDTPQSPWADHRARYDQLRRWQPHAGDLDTYEAIGGRYYFREQHNTKPSLLVALRPPVSQNCGFGGYYLVTNVDDSTMTPEESARMEFELLFIAGLDEFADEQAAKDKLAATGP